MNTCAVGDVVTVCGLVKVLATGQEAGGAVGAGGGSKFPKGGNGQKQQQKQGLFLIYLDAVSLEANRRAMRGTEGEAQPSAGPDGVLSGLPPGVPGFTIRDLQFIVKFSQVGTLAGLVCRCFSPSNFTRPVLSQSLGMPRCTLRPY